MQNWLDEQRRCGFQPQRDRQTTAERLDQAPLLVRRPEGTEVRHLPAFPPGPFERRAERLPSGGERHVSVSLTRSMLGVGRATGMRYPC